MQWLKVRFNPPSHPIGDTGEAPAKKPLLPHRCRLILPLLVVLLAASPLVYADCYDGPLCPSREELHGKYNSYLCRSTNCCDNNPLCCSHVEICDLTKCGPMPPTYCCPAGKQYDVTYQCCLPEGQAVTSVAMHATAKYGDKCIGYCEAKQEEIGKKCAYGEGPCRDDSDCDEGLTCSRNPSVLVDWESACCKPGQTWDGKDCIKVGDERKTPWAMTWTRSGGNPQTAEVKEGGGGPIYIYTVAGAMIPNGTEAAGWGAECADDRGRWPGSQQPWPDGWPKSPDDQGNGWFGCYPDPNGNDGHCRYCEAAWPYRCPPSPIWFEARNFGNNYSKATLHYVCNGPFDGLDATILPWMTYGEGCPPELDCVGWDCNCGRDMDGYKEKRLDDGTYEKVTDGGDRADGLKDWDGSGGCVSPDFPQSCNELQRTSCIRGNLPGTPHQCNDAISGHGSFPAPQVEAGMPVNPTDDDTSEEYATSENGQDAIDIIPDVCGRIQRKEVENVGGYYPQEAGDTPDNWFDYTITEYDKNRNPIWVRTVNGEMAGQRGNILPSPPKPWTILNENILEHSLQDRTRYLQIDVNYTVHNEIMRRDLVKQCTWVGCSRLEEDVTSYTERTCYEQCDHSWSCSETPILESGAPPCCCTPQGPQKEGNENKVQDPNNPLIPDDGWRCKSTYSADCDGDGSGDTTLQIRTEDDCWCESYCWGCWHLGGQTTDYPVTKPDENEVEQIVYEQINDTSTVKAAPYGSHITVENTVTGEQSETVNYVTGFMSYNYSVAPAYAAGYITFKAVDEETGRIDVFSGFRLNVPQVAVLDFYAKEYPVMHDLSALESTLPSEYILIQPPPELPYTVTNVEERSRLAYLLNLTRKCYDVMYRNWPDGEKDIADPIYYRETRNPSKKFFMFQDFFAGWGTKYSWMQPLVLVDRAYTPPCLNYINEVSYDIPLYRNYHEDEPSYYDYESVYLMYVNPERGIESKNYEPGMLNNVYVTKYSKPIHDVYARYAPACDDPYYDSKKLECSGEDTFNCPDMCSQIATAFCNEETGLCDCWWREHLDTIYPISDVECNNTDWRMSDLIPCEGIPGGYKSFCLGEDEADPAKRQKYQAYWGEFFQYRYRWNRDDDKCDIEYVKGCEPRTIEPRSYTLFFETSTLNKSEWDDAELTVYDNFRQTTFKPFGEKSPLEEPERTMDYSGLKLKIKKGHSLRYYAEGEESGENKYEVTIKAEDMFTGEEAYPGNRVHVEFRYPYAMHTGWYNVGDVISGIDVTSRMDIVLTLKSLDWGLGDMYASSAGRSPPFTSAIPVPKPNVGDYLVGNIWLVFVAFAAVMSYRFFSGRAMDFKDMWDEFHGKK